MIDWRRAMVVVTLAALLPAPGAARFLWFGKKKQVERVVVVPAPLPPRRITLRPVPPAAGRAACVDVRHVAAAQLFGDAAVELTLRGGARYRLFFEQGCPALDFYQGFYYRRAELGRLCAGHDAVISRSGGECPIASIMPIRKFHAAPARRPAVRPVLHRRHGKRL